MRPKLHLAALLFHNIIKSNFMSHFKIYTFWILAFVIIVLSTMKIFNLVVSASNTVVVDSQITTHLPIIPVSASASTTETVASTSPSFNDTSSQSAISPMQSTGKLFSQMSRRSYLIFPTMASGADQALDGFTMTTENRSE